MQRTEDGWLFWGRRAYGQPIAHPAHRTLERLFAKEQAAQRHVQRKEQRYHQQQWLPDVAVLGRCGQIVSKGGQWIGQFCAVGGRGQLG